MADNESFDLLDGLRLAFDAEGRHLVAHLQPPENSDPLKLAWLETKLRELGLDLLALDPRAINQLLQHFNAGETPEPLVIGERLDGEFSLRVSKDGMTAHLSLTPAKGGRPVDLQAIHDRLAEQGIVHGVMNPAIEAAVNAGEASDQLIAQGTPPVHGADARIESCLPQTGHAALCVSDKDFIIAAARKCRAGQRAVDRGCRRCVGLIRKIFWPDNRHRRSAITWNRLADG